MVLSRFCKRKPELGGESRTRASAWWGQIEQQHHHRDDQAPWISSEKEVRDCKVLKKGSTIAIWVIGRKCIEEYKYKSQDKVTLDVSRKIPLFHIIFLPFLSSLSNRLGIRKISKSSYHFRRREQKSLFIISKRVQQLLSGISFCRTLILWLDRET